MSKFDQYLLWSKNGTGPNSLLQVLENHYRDLSAMYLQKGMKEEALLFQEAASEFEKLGSGTSKTKKK